MSHGVAAASTAERKGTGMTEIRMVFDTIAGAVGQMQSTASQNMDTAAQQFRYVQDAVGSYFTDAAGSELDTTQQIWSKHADQHDVCRGIRLPGGSRDQHHGGHGDLSSGVPRLRACFRNAT